MYTNIYMHTYICTYTHTYILHVHTHTHARTHTCIITFYGLQHLEHWMQSSEEIERKRAVNCLSNLLVTYYNELEKNPFEVRPTGASSNDLLALLYMLNCDLPK